MHPHPQVPPFRASKFKVTNGEFAAFVRAGGYGARKWWSEEGWGWRTFRNVKWPTFWVLGERGAAARWAAVRGASGVRACMQHAPRVCCVRARLTRTKARRDACHAPAWHAHARTHTRVFPTQARQQHLHAARPAALSSRSP